MNFDRTHRCEQTVQVSKEPNGSTQELRDSHSYLTGTEIRVTGEEDQSNFTREREESSREKAEYNLKRGSARVSESEAEERRV